MKRTSEAEKNPLTKKERRKIVVHMRDGQMSDPSSKVTLLFLYFTGIRDTLSGNIFLCNRKTQQRLT